MSLFRRGDVWWYEFWFSGRRIQESSKSPSKTIARTAEQNRRRELEEGFNNFTDIRRERVRTFSDVADEFFNGYRLRLPNSAVFADYAIDHLKRLLGSKMLVDFNEAVVIKYQNDRLDEGTAPKTINEEVGFLLRILGEPGDIIRARLRKRKMLKLRVRKAYSGDEKKRMLEEARKARSPHIYLALTLALNAGMRDAEIKTLTWAQINFAKEFLAVGRSKTEGGEGRTIPLNSELFAVLTGYVEWYKNKFGEIRPEWYVFPFGKPQPTDPARHVTTLKTAWTNVRDNAKGYTTDDNARALIVTTLLNESTLACRSEYTALFRRYLAFLWLAFHGETGRFRNFLSYDRKWLEEVGSEDSHGRALWALGTVFCHSQDAGLRGAAGRLFEAAAPVSLTFTSPRAWAFSVLGMQAYLDCFPGDRLIQGTRNTVANRLLDVFERTHSPTWDWFEKSLSYSNARLSQALLVAGCESDNKRMVEAGCDSLRWLVAEQRRGDVFMPIGSKGFFTEGGEKASFDQQPVEACGTISACLQAYRITNENQWLEEAWRAFRWFLGKNDLEVPLYDATTGGCRDGLHPDRVNENQGAESTLSFLMALLEMQGMEMPTAKEQHQEMSVCL